MKIQGNENNLYLLKELGNRIKDTRIALSMTRAELAVKSGVSLKTMERIESGENIKIENLLNVLRSLELLKNLDVLVPEQESLFYKETKAKRYRASKSGKVAEDVTWKWGDE